MTNTTKIPIYRIKVTGRVLNQMKEEFTASHTAIYQALNFFCNSDKGIKIRKYAMNHGGMLVCKEVPVE